MLSSPQRTKYENLNSTAFKKESTAFYHLTDDSAKLKINEASEYLLDCSEADGYDPELEKVIEGIDEKLGFSNFTNLQDFIEFNEKRK